MVLLAVAACAPLAAAETCKVIIRLNAGSAATVLNLNEVMLLGKDGNKIPLTNPQQSTVSGVYGASGCIDGVVNETLGCHTDPSDGNPWLMASFDCPGGNANGAVGTAAVWNRPDDYMDRILAFQLQLLGTNDAVQANYSFRDFNNGQAAAGYNFTVCPANCDACSSATACTSCAQSFILSYGACGKERQARQ